MNKNPPRVHLDLVLTYDNKHRLHVTYNQPTMDSN